MLVSVGDLSLSCTSLLAGWVTTLWLSHPLSVSQHGQLSLPSFRDHLMSSNPCCSGLRRQTAECVVRGVAYHPRQRVFLATRLECRLAAIGTEMSAALLSCRLWEPTSHWGHCLFAFSSNYIDWSQCLYNIRHQSDWKYTVGAVAVRKVKLWPDVAKI